MAIVEAGTAAQYVTDLLRTRPPGFPAGCPPESRAPVVPDPSWLSAPLGEVLRRRESVRDFSPHPLAMREVSTVVSSACAAECQAWPASMHGAAPITVLLAAHRVSGLSPGLYALEAGSGQAPSLVGSRLPESIRASYGNAPAHLLICASASREPGGASGPGYGALLVRIGTLGYAAWLAAVAIGLGGSVYGTGCHDVTTAARLLDPGCRHFFTVAIGMAASDAHPQQTEGTDR